MACRHYKNGKCETGCTCEGEVSKCDFTSELVDASGGSYRFLFLKTMELLDELREHMTCSLPCIYCAKYNINSVCDGQFEWIYEDRIKREIGQVK